MCKVFSVVVGRDCNIEWNTNIVNILSALRFVAGYLECRVLTKSVI